MGTDVMVLGAGMIGTCTALQLARRGHSVVLIDRREPGRETSYGNAGMIQREAVEPYAFPRSWSALFDVAFKRGVDVNYHLGALPGMATHLARYWQASAPARYAAIVRQYSHLIAQSRDEHALLIDESKAWDLIRKTGYRHGFRTEARLAIAVQRAARLQQQHGIGHALFDADQLAAAEPGLRARLAGAVLWTDAWSASDPGALVQRYADRFVELGGRLLRGDASTLSQDGAGWMARADEGTIRARHAVIALGPWADEATRRLGYRLPLFVKRGYHRHYQGGPGLRVPMLDAERGLVLAPMAEGMRLTTGAEFARIGAPPTPVQLGKAERAAGELLELGTPVEATPWMGMRPCTIDMKPIIGPAPRHAGLWFNFGHAHHGFTLGPVAGRLVAELIEAQPTCLDVAPFDATRFRT